jgi:hypothetical protein
MDDLEFTKRHLTVLYTGLKSVHVARPISDQSQSLIASGCVLKLPTGIASLCMISDRAIGRGSLSATAAGSLPISRTRRIRSGGL